MLFEVRILPRGNPPELAHRRRKAGSIRLAEWKALEGKVLKKPLKASFKKAIVRSDYRKSTGQSSS